jgi:hypothetical protein
MSTDRARPNFFIILGLPPEEPWDEASYARALSEKRNLWARQVQGTDERNATAEAQRNLRLRREMERVMGDPQARERERQAALAVRQDELRQRRRMIADQLEDMLEKGYLLEDEYERLRDEEAIHADDTLRQRLEDAERRPRGQGDGDEQRLDQAMEQDLRRYLNVVGQPDLYAVLRLADPEIGEATPADRLLAAAGGLSQKARNASDRGRAEAEAMQSLADIGRQVLGSPDLKRRHDATVRLWSLEALVDRYESSLEIARHIRSRQFEKFLREAAARGIDISAARNDLIARFRKRGWSVDVPSAAFEATLRAEVRCPSCSRLNDPESDHCTHCGRALRGACPRCGATALGMPGACSACGFPVGERDYVEHLVGQAEACLARGDVKGADERVTEAGRLWPVPADRSDDLSDRIRASSTRIENLRVAQRELIRQVDPLMDARNYQAAARLLRGALLSQPSLAGHLQECEDAIRASDQRLRDARATGLSDEQRAEQYSAALRLCADNDEALSELSLISLSPVIPGPVSALGHPPRMSVHEVELDSPPADRGVVKIVCAGLLDRSPQAGAEFPEADLKRYRTVTRGARDIWISEKEWLRRYTLVLVLYGRCYVGGTRWYARGPEIAGLRTEHAGTSVHVTWTWPTEAPDGAEVSEALVSWDDGPEIGDPVNAPAQHYVTREPGTANGRCEIPAAGGLSVKVAAIVRDQGTAYVTSGVRADARRQPITLRYEVQAGHGRRAKLVIRVEGGRLDQLPALSLRARPDNRPASRDGDEEVTQIQAGLATREIPIKLEDVKGRRIEPRSCRLFVARDPDGASVRIIDPG